MAYTINKVDRLLHNELDDGFPHDLGKEFWETMEKIAMAWNKGLRDEVIRMLQSEGLSIEWFKWGHSGGFPVLVVKLLVTPEPTKAWKIADQLAEMVSAATRAGVACLIHPGLLTGVD